MDQGLRQPIASSSAAAASSRASTWTRPCPSRWPKRPTRWRDIGIIIVDGNQIEVTEDTFEFNPSAHLRWDVSDRTQLRFSVARTVRRPSFDQLNPTLIIDDEESILGNPTLDQETALGVDAGFDVELGGQDAIMGVNFFYRDVVATRSS